MVKNIYETIKNRSIEQNFLKPNGNTRGRTYDYAVLYTGVVENGGMFEDKIICDLGARDGIFGAWLTKYAKKVYVSDYFEEWGKGTDNDLGQIDQWVKLWKNYAPNPERLVCEHQDMTRLTYENNMFDITISTSVIEHIHNQIDRKSVV